MIKTHNYLDFFILARWTICYYFITMEMYSEKKSHTTQQFLELLFHANLVSGVFYACGYSVLGLITPMKFTRAVLDIVKLSILI